MAEGVTRYLEDHSEAVIATVKAEIGKHLKRMKKQGGAAG